MYLKLRNSVDSDSDLDIHKYMPVFADYKKRVNSQRRYSKDGGVIVGDSFTDIRNITLDFNVVSETDTPYRAVLNELVGFFNPIKAPYYLIDTDNDLRAQIVLESISDRPKTKGLEKLFGNNKLGLKMLDGHWEDLTSNSADSGTGGLENNETLVVNNDSFIDCYPIITVDPLQTNQLFTIRNETTGDQIEIGSNFFVTGSSFIINSQDGTLFLDNGVSLVEASASIADGSGFIKLIAGNNTIKYQSNFGAINMQVDFRRRYAF